jgi:hypothetical protein
LVVTKLDRLARSLPDCRQGNRRRAHRGLGSSQSGWVGVRPHRSGRTAALQCARDGC